MSNVANASDPTSSTSIAAAATGRDERTVVIVEDVVTTGGSSLLAIQRVEEFGCRVTEVIAIVDRLEGGAENFRAKGYPLRSLLTIRDFGIEPPAAG